MGCSLMSRSLFFKATIADGAAGDQWWRTHCRIRSASGAGHNMTRPGSLTSLLMSAKHAVPAEPGDLCLGHTERFVEYGIGVGAEGPGGSVRRPERCLPRQARQNPGLCPLPEATGV